MISLIYKYTWSEINQSGSRKETDYYYYNNQLYERLCLVFILTQYRVGNQSLIKRALSKKSEFFERYIV